MTPMYAILAALLTLVYIATYALDEGLAERAGLFYLLAVVVLALFDRYRPKKGVGSRARV